MANVCDVCQEPVHRTRFVGGKFVGIDCRCLQERRPRVDAPALDLQYSDLTLAHVNDFAGKPLRVTSSRELAAAEKTYDFISVVRNQNEQNFDDAPQQRHITVADIYKRKFHRGA